jgi:hypothetical protein
VADDVEHARMQRGLAAHEVDAFVLVVVAEFV